MTIEMLDAIEIHNDCGYDVDSYFFVEDRYADEYQEVEKFVNVRNQ